VYTGTAQKELMKSISIKTKKKQPELKREILMKWFL
jgi:hypothetical protein